MQGKAAGIRGTMNRVASIVAPVFFGALAEILKMNGVPKMIAIEISFYVMGAIVTLLMGALVVHVLRSPDLTASNVIRTGDPSDN